MSFRISIALLLSVMSTAFVSADDGYALGEMTMPVDAGKTNAPSPRNLESEETPDGIMYLNSYDVVSQIEDKHRQLNELELDLKIVRAQQELQEARRNQMAGDELIAALQADLSGGSSPTHHAEPTPRRENHSQLGAAASNWFVESITRFNGVRSAILVSESGRRVPARIGGHLDDGSEVVAISGTAVRVKQDGKTRTLPIAMVQTHPTVPTVSTDADQGNVAPRGW